MNNFPPLDNWKEVLELSTTGISEKGQTWLGDVVFNVKNAKDSNGNLVEVINHRAKTFALGYEIQGDAKSRRIWYFLCTASPINDNTKTKAESIEPNEVSIDITARSIEVGNYSVIRTIAKYGDTNYSSFFTQVPELPVIGV